MRWLKSKTSSLLGIIRRRPLGTSFIISFLFLAVWIGYDLFILGWMEWVGWTGFGPFTDPNENYHHGKTSWVLTELLFIPVTLAYGNLRFNINELKIADDRNEEILLLSNIDKMTELFRDNQY